MGALIPVVVGVDPGGSATGIVTRHGDRLLGWRLMQRHRQPFGGEDGYLREVLAVIRDAPTNLVDWDDPRRGVRLEDLCDRLIVVEDVAAPTPHMGLTNVRGLLDTAIVLGAILAAHQDAVVVPPGQHGSAPLVCYPPQLRPERGQGCGKDQLRHCRSAYDIAGAGAMLVRAQEGRPA